MRAHTIGLVAQSLAVIGPTVRDDMMTALALRAPAGVRRGT
jgi:hypothetical protein